MRVDILAIGSRGDVQPYVALGRGLQTAGYRVRMVTLSGFEEFVRSCGLGHLAIGDSPQEIASTEAGRDWLKRRSTTAGFLRGFVRVANSLIEEGIANYWKSCGELEALIASPIGLLAGGHIAERLKIPLIQAQLVPPGEPTRYNWEGRRDLSTAIWGGWRALLDLTFRSLIWGQLRRRTNAARQAVLGLPALSLAEPFKSLRRERSPVLCGYSPLVAPKLPDWGDWIHMTGYWFLDQSSGWTPTEELTGFLQSGPPPVFVGFGSTPFPRPAEATAMIVRALARAGQRGIVLSGGSGLLAGRLSDTVLSVDAVPHEWLFSRVGAAVHHGGAGVTGAALRAGLPSVVVPVFADQPFWGERVFALGAGPRPIPAKRLNEDNLAAAIQATGSKEMRARAALVGERIRAEDGVRQAVMVINRYLGRSGFETARHQHAG